MDKDKISCVYQIINFETRRRYVGSTVNLQRRKRQHIFCMRNGDPAYSEKMKQDYIQYGEEMFIFQILELCDNKEELRELEQKWIDIMQPEYNAVMKAFGWDYIREGAKQKISRTVKQLWDEGKYPRKKAPYKWKDGKPNRKGVKLSYETKQKISAAMTGKGNPNYGKPRTAEMKRKQSEKMAKTYVGAVSPEGEIFAPIHNMSAFCKEHDLAISSMIGLMRGRIKQHKGWTRLSE